MTDNKCENIAFRIAYESLLKSVSFTLSDWILHNMKEAIKNSRDTKKLSDSDIQNIVYKVEDNYLRQARRFRNELEKHINDATEE